MFDNIKTRLLKLSEMSWENLRELKAWMKRSQSFNKHFDVDAFNNPKLKIAQAVNQQGTTLVFCPVETVLMVSAYCVNPNVDPLTARNAGDYLDAAIAREAQKMGTSKIMIVVPEEFPPSKASGNT